MTQENGRRSVGRPPLTDRATLLAAAREVGFHDLTVGTVTVRVGVKYSTFYRHFASLDDLVTAMVDDVCAEVELPDRDLPWQTVVERTCAELIELHLRHPGLAEAVVRLPAMPTGPLRIFEYLTGSLLAAGIPADEAALGAAYALETVSIGPMTTPGAGHSLDDRQQQAENREVLDPRVCAATAGIAGDGGRAWTMRKVDLLIRGLESVVGADPVRSTR